MRSFRDYSIPTKLTWMNMTVSIVALLLACTTFMAFDLISVRQAIVRHLTIQAQIIAANSTSALLFNDPQSAEKTLSALRSAPNVIEAVIAKPGSGPFAAYRRDPVGNDPVGHDRYRRGTLVSSEQLRWFSNSTIEVAIPIVFQDKTIATVYIRSGMKELFARLRRYLLIVGAVFLMSLGAAVLMSSLIRKVVTVPILHLAEAARIVSRDKTYSVRVPPTRNRDELSMLIDMFNAMLQQIEAGDSALREAQETLEQRVRVRTEQLRAANTDLESFSYSVSHDLRAPVRHITGFSRLLDDECGSTMDDNARHYLNRIREAVKNMDELIEGLLKLGRIGRRELSCVATDLDALLREVLLEMEPDLEGRQIDWRIGNLATISCDPGLVKQVFANLVANAVKYTRGRTVAVIEVGRIAEPGVDVFFVRDNGAGFDQQYAGKLFRVFERLHTAEEFEGTGVGLSTVQRIVKKHGGDIWAKAEVDKGATFFFVLAAANYRLGAVAGSSSA